MVDLTELEALLAKATQEYGVRQAAVIRGNDPITINRARHDFEKSAAALMPHLPSLIQRIRDLERVEVGWQPVETAEPHRVVLVNCEWGVLIADFVLGRWWAGFDSYGNDRELTSVTHWKPLPEQPAAVVEATDAR